MEFVQECDRALLLVRTLGTARTPDRCLGSFNVRSPLQTGSRTTSKVHSRFWTLGSLVVSFADKTAAAEFQAWPTEIL